MSGVCVCGGVGDGGGWRMKPKQSCLLRRRLLKLFEVCVGEWRGVGCGEARGACLTIEQIHCPFTK